MNIRRTIQRLLGEARFGDPAELDRLYGSDFDSRGRLNFAAADHDELEVPAILRKSLAHHGYKYQGAAEEHSKLIAPANPKDYITHRYQHPQGPEVFIGVHTNPNQFEMKWLRRSSANSNMGVGGHELTKVLDHFHK